MMPATALRILEEVPQRVTDGTALRDVLKEAVGAYQVLLLGYARGILDDGDLARDVVQDTFLRLHGELRKGEPENVKAWLFRVCRNRALDVLRKNRRLQVTDGAWLNRVPDEMQATPSAGAELRETHERALELLERLPENQREVIRLKFQAELSYREISEVTNLSMGNVGYLLHHGLKRLRELMHETEG